MHNLRTLPTGFCLIVLPAFELVRFAWLEKNLPEALTQQLAVRTGITSRIYFYLHIFTKRFHVCLIIFLSPINGDIVFIAIVSQRHDYV